METKNPKGHGWLKSTLSHITQAACVRQYKLNCGHRLQTHEEELPVGHGATAQESRGHDQARQTEGEEVLLSGACASNYRYFA